jgi:pSer/pThr/pTyr-binding forkhead associated (FHA) protein
MDIGLVCDSCDAFNPMTAQACASCGTALSLGGPKKPVATTPRGTANQPAQQQPPGPSPRPRVTGAQAASASPAAAGAPCTVCGTPIPPGHMFCGKCGTRVGAAASKPASPPVERRTMFFGAMQAARAKLVLIKGDGLDGVSFTLAGQDHIAGRLDCPLLFHEDPFLSPRHANFYYKDGKLHVKDEASANGVFIRIRAPMPLRSSDTFLVGEQVLRVETTPPETAGLGPDDDGTYFYASPRRASRMRLVQLLRGGDTGLVYRAAGDVVTCGREGNDINFPEDPFISGRHAQVSFSDAGLMLTDLGSKNGTFLRINNESPLSHGDYVFMGQQLLRVEIV